MSLATKMESTATTSLPQARPQATPAILNRRRKASCPVLRKTPRPGQQASMRKKPYQTRPTPPAAAAAADIAARLVGVSEASIIALRAGYAAAEEEKKARQCGDMPVRACIYERNEYTKQGPVPVLRAVVRMKGSSSSLSSSPFSPLDRVQTGRVGKPRATDPAKKLTEQRRNEAFARREAALEKGRVERAMKEEIIKQREWGVPKKKVVPIKERSLMQRLAAGNPKQFSLKRN